jgi:GNAT superfamily N-acetyltransferase
MSTDLRNVAWDSLSGPHARFSSGSDVARRYAEGFSPIAGFAEPSNPDLHSLKPYCRPEDRIFTEGWSGPAPPDWQVHSESVVVKMVWDGAAPREDPAPELTQATRPGPFGLRTIELGEYFGCFEDGKLIAMAGERMWSGRFHEVSGVCTDPGYQGRGLARRLSLKIVRRQLARGEMPFLHVMQANTVARQLYERLGFKVYRESVLRVISPRDRS